MQWLAPQTKTLKAVWASTLELQPRAVWQDAVRNGFQLILKHYGGVQQFLQKNLLQPYVRCTVRGYKLVCAFNGIEARTPEVGHGHLFSVLHSRGERVRVETDLLHWWQLPPIPTEA